MNTAKISGDVQTPSQMQPPKKCFVIMPISDHSDYEPGHFGRVYEHLLKPAIEKAGYDPIRADDENKTDYIVVGIIRRIIEADIVVCDYSSRNYNVMYELGLRHAFNKPVVLIKDLITDKVFDIQGLRYTEYDQSLRVDSVEKDRLKITKSIVDTVNTKDGFVNSPIQLAKITPAEIPDQKTISSDTNIILNTLSSIQKSIENSFYDEKLRFFTIEDEKINFSNGGSAVMGDEVFDRNGLTVGTLVDIHPADKRIFLKDEFGKVIPYYAYSVRSKGLTTIPF